MGVNRRPAVTAAADTLPNAAVHASPRDWVICCRYRNQHPEGKAMTQYVGLDVSMKETKLHALDEAMRSR
jgi:hypothetical protein